MKVSYLVKEGVFLVLCRGGGMRPLGSVVVVGIGMFTSLVLTNLPFILTTRDGSSLCFIPGGGARAGGRAMITPGRGDRKAAICSASTASAPMMIGSITKGAHSMSRCGHQCASHRGAFSVRGSALCVRRGPCDRQKR